MAELESAESAKYKRYVLGMLTFVFTLNFLDRGLINLLLEPIKNDLNLSDTQLGFLTGIAFGLFYAVLGVPIARWADFGNRVTITSIAIALWGVTVMSCVFVTNFVQMVAARIAAAVGEAGCMPPTYSLVGEYFPEPGERTRAMAIYWLANPIAALTAFVAGGWLNEYFGWRVTFFIIGIPALAAAILVKLTIRDPRYVAGRVLVRQRSTLPIAQVLRILWSQKSTRHLGIAIILIFTMGLGLAPWYAAFMMRSHGMGTAELGVWLGLIFGVAGIVGILLGGYIAGRWFAHDEPLQMSTCAVMVASMTPLSVLFLLVPHNVQALIALAPLPLMFSFVLGPAFALLQRLVADRMRATTLAVVMLLANLIGMGIGPQIVGMLSDWLRPTFGNESLRYAMLIASCVSMWSAWHFWYAGRNMKEDLQAVVESAA